VSIALSVVIPTYRRPHLLHRCLVPLLSQALDPNTYEIIVVDDGRDPLTQTVVETLAHRHPGGPLLRYLQPPAGKRGPAAARNCGWRAAGGRVIAFTDDDTIPFVDWLSEGMRAMVPGVAAAAGRVKVPISAWPTDYERNVKRLESAEFVTANCFVRRDILERIGGFDERFTRAWREDSDLHFTLLENGGEVVSAPQALVLHPVRETSWGVSLREQRNMEFDALLYKKHPALYRQRIRAHPPLAYYGAVLALVAMIVSAFAAQPALLLGAAAMWLVLTLKLCRRRLSGTSRRPAHIAEMVATSIVIPVAAVYWRLVGALRFRAPFA
jgi:glycosyltransferase involved in cell wall biosynthesis